MDQENNLNYLMYIQWVNMVVRFVLHLNLNHKKIKINKYSFPNIQHLLAINIHLRLLKNVIQHYNDGLIEVLQWHTNDTSNMNLDQQKNQLHQVDMYNFLYSTENFLYAMENFLLLSAILLLTLNSDQRLFS
jgi:hypothetical protein